MEAHQAEATIPNSGLRNFRARDVLNNLVKNSNSIEDENYLGDITDSDFKDDKSSGQTSLKYNLDGKLLEFRSNDLNLLKDIDDYASSQGATKYDEDNSEIRKGELQNVIVTNINGFSNSVKEISDLPITRESQLRRLEEDIGIIPSDPYSINLVKRYDDFIKYYDTVDLDDLDILLFEKFESLITKGFNINDKIYFKILSDTSRNANEMKIISLIGISTVLLLTGILINVNKSNKLAEKIFTQSVKTGNYVKNPRLDITMAPGYIFGKINVGRFPLLKDLMDRIEDDNYKKELEDTIAKSRESYSSEDETFQKPTPWFRKKLGYFGVSKRIE
jgi:hypothetical protein